MACVANLEQLMMIETMVEFAVNQSTNETLRWNNNNTTNKKGNIE